MTTEKNITVIDLGSNSVRMVINKIHSDGTWDELVKMRSTVRLSEGMGSDNVLRAASMQRVIDALCNFCAEARKYKSATIVAIATAAVRTASNRQIFLDEVKVKCGIEFDVISGEDEAYYSYLAARESLNVRNGLIFDTGGGSTEIVLVRNKELVHSASIPCGAVVLTERMAGRPQPSLYRLVQGYIGSVDWIDKAEGLPLYGIGGSARTLGSLVKKRCLMPDEVHSLSVPYKDAAAAYQKLFSTPPELRVNIAGMDKSRADVLLAGLTPMKVMMDMLGSPKIVLCAYGVKEGVFYRVKNEILKSDWGKQSTKTRKVRNKQ
ncbi:MAG: hypothetical protein Q4C12_08660 [Clostridia bacterium]|nr:hypothetical protein [Clostridia bacterium]